MQYLVSVISPTCGPGVPGSIRCSCKCESLDEYDSRVEVASTVNGPLALGRTISSSTQVTQRVVYCSSLGHVGIASLLSCLREMRRSELRKHGATFQGGSAAQLAQQSLFQKQRRCHCRVHRGLQRCLHQRGLVATEMVVLDMLDAFRPDHAVGYSFFFRMLGPTMWLSWNKTRVNCST